MTYDNRSHAATIDSRYNRVVSGVRSILRDEFNGSGGPEAIRSDLWEVAVGAGMSVSLSGSTLAIAAGTNAGVQTTLTSQQTFVIPSRVILGFQQSSAAKAVNQAIRVELVMVKSDGTLDENNRIHFGQTLTGNSLTTNGGELVSVSDGFSQAATASVTNSNTSAVFYELSFEPDQVLAVQGTLNVGRNTSLQRDHFIPNPDAQYKVRITVINAAGFAGAANTFSVYCLTALETTEVQAEITGMRGYGATPTVSFTNTTLNIQQQASATAAGQTTFFKRVSTADTNAASVSASASSIGSVYAANNSASWRYLKLYNKATAPVVGTDVPTHTIGIPPNGAVAVEPPIYMRFSTGIAIAITAGIADTDATAIGANEVVVNINRT